MKLRFTFIVLIFSLSVSCKKKNPVCSEGNCENGYGVKAYLDGGYEKGEWLNGELNGQGEQFFGTSSDFSGDSYVGMFKNGRYHGSGLYEDVSEGFVYDGTWNNGAPVGDEILKFDIEKKRATVSK